MCLSVLVVRIGPKKSGVNLPVPTNGTQANLPAKLKVRARTCACACRTCIP
mgnify:CR=1 FL=1